MVMHRIKTAKSSDWVGLLIISLACLLKGITYLPFAVDDGPIPAVERWIPMWIAAAVWIGVGMLGLLAVWRRRGGPLMVGAGTSLHVLWGLLYMGAWLSGASERSYVTSILYFAFAAMVLWGYGRGPKGVSA